MPCRPPTSSRHRVESEEFPPDGLSHFDEQVFRDALNIKVVFPRGGFIDPCNAFAQSTGFATWQAALSVMRAGVTLSGRVPLPKGKSFATLAVFVSQLAGDGLECIECDLPRVSLALPGGRGILQPAVEN